MSAGERMRPVAAIPTETWRTVPGVATDLDDTLTAHGRLSARVLGALEMLAEQGIPCVVATGRPVGWAEVLASVLPVQAVVAENGAAWVVREGKGVRVAFVDDASTRDAHRSRAHAMVQTLRDELPALTPVHDWTVRATDLTLDIGERVTVPQAVVQQALARVRGAGLHAVASTVHLHVSGAAPDKVRGLRAALADLGHDPSLLASRWVYVGDSPNDAAPFEAVEHSVGVSGVRRFEDVLPVLPAYVTRGGAGDGFVEVVEALCAARGAA